MISVLLVERDASVARLYKEELDEAGFSVRVLPDLESALADLRQRPAQVLITDQSSAGVRVKSWLPMARRVHEGPVVVLGPSPREMPEACHDLAAVPKTSDLQPLLNSLRRHAFRLTWSNAAARVC